jgi:carbon-monoxide dehydrogenase large subunit
MDGLLDGRARYAADLIAPGALHLQFVRSPLAHARIASIDTDGAARAPGVVGVFTAADLDVVDIWEIHMIPEVFAQPALARDTVRYVGDRVAAVVATSAAAAADAAEQVVVRYDTLPVVPDAQSALERPPVFAEHGSNVALEWLTDVGEWRSGDGDVEVQGVVVMPRVAVAPMEGFSILAVPEADGRLTLHASTQSPGHTRTQMARALGLAPDRIRVLVPRVGGAFGGKSLGGIAEYAVTAAVARALGAPVRFHEERSANLVSMQGRGLRLTYRLRADRDGRIRGVDVDELCDAGAYPQTNSVEPGKTLMMMCGPYRVPAVRFRARSVVTNLTPSGAYRGPGRAEASAVLERALDQVAAALDLDPVEVRRRNLLTREELPLESITGAHYDVADHHAVLDQLVTLARYDELRTEQAKRRERRTGTQLGIGIATVVDSSAWFSRNETVRVDVDTKGVVHVYAATASAGQSHADAFTNIVCSVLPVAPAQVDVIEGDTDAAAGTGTSGSRSTQLAGTALKQAADEILGAATQRAADLLEAAPADVVVTGDGFAVRGAPARGIPFATVAASIDADDGKAFDSTCVFDQPAPTYPSGAQLSVVEVDPETGAVDVIRHVAVTDCGVVIDPPGALGQVVGACAQGVGQALYEHLVYDEDGSPRNASLAEYLVPSAVEVPHFETAFLTTPTDVNPLGAKGVGELGMVAAPAAIRNAVLDALAPFGVDHIDMPCSPERVWQAIRAASSPRPHAPGVS